MYCKLWSYVLWPLNERPLKKYLRVLSFLNRILYPSEVALLLLKHPLKGSLAFLRYAIKSSKRLFKRTSCKSLENFFIWLKATAGQLIYSLVSLGLMIWIGLLSLASNAILRKNKVDELYIHAFPFYKKRSYKKRPIKFFNHKKQQPIEFFKIRNDFFY